MNEILNDLSTQSLTEAIKANLYSFFRFFERSEKAEFFENKHLVRWHTQISHPWFNGVLVTRANEAIDESMIKESFSFFETHAVSQFSWWLENKIPISDWDRSLRAQGFSYVKGPPGMAIDLAALKPLEQLPVDLQIKPVIGLDGLRDWTSTLVRGFEFPGTWEESMYDLFATLGLDLPIRHYLGYLAGEPVATSTLFLAAGVAGIYNVASLPQARKRGIGTALTLNPLMDAKELGYRASILQSSDAGFGVYQKLGFQKLCNMDSYHWVDKADPD